jgi:nucleotide-binding universal stress UspA family protein
MSRCILVGVDACLSLPTYAALEMVCQVLEQDASAFHLILLHVIPVPVDPTPRWGKPLGSWTYAPPTNGQLRQARHALQRARLVVAQREISLASIELLVRAGTPTDELVRVARERNVDLLILGSHPPSHFGLLRRMFLGSITRRVVRVAPCRVLLARLPSLFDAGDLTAWYEQALQRCLHQQTSTLVVFTPTEVARHFTRTDQAIGPREVEAAAHALERLAAQGLLLCQVVHGEMRCWND